MRSFNTRSFLDSFRELGMDLSGVNIVQVTAAALHSHVDVEKMAQSDKDEGDGDVDCTFVTFGEADVFYGDVDVCCGSGRIIVIVR